ncbi:MAG TPA: phosphoenolpyruvate-protein phosphotransferase PtsP [Succinivibrionaceae bacterium]|nr:phosphoenolpyruvate-protein phosphotransferase PtsP [Succinivibrionaceae bacterium]
MDDRQSKMLLALRQITENVSAQSSLNEAIALLVVSIRNATGADCCSLYLVDELGEYLTLAGTDGLDKKAVGKARLRLGEGLVGSVGQKQELLDLADAPSDPKFKYLPEVGEDKFFSFLGVPIIYQGELLGVLVIQSREKRQFGAVEESFLVTLSAQMSSIIAVSRASKEEDTDCVRRYRGEQGTGGIAIAKAVVWQPDVLLSDVTIQHTNEPYVQQELFHQTVFQLQTEMDLNTLHMNESGQKEAAFGYMSGYGSLLDDPTFQDEVDTEILANGMTASSAVKIVAERRLADLEGEDDHDRYLDLRDLSEIILSRLMNFTSHTSELSEEVILVVRNLPAAMVAEFKRYRVCGFVSMDSASNSHTAVLARDLGIPSVSGLFFDINSINGRNVIVDGMNAELLVDPSQSVVSEYRQLMTLDREQEDLFSKEKFEKGITLDGQRIEIKLNAGLSQEEMTNLPEQTDGVGLYRTEISFMLCKSFPSEAQQCQWYSSILKQFKGKSVTMRTLDVGGDKSLSYLPIEESNPLLGWRGVRITVDQPQILKTQLRAMILANKDHGNLEIMLPMVSRLSEVNIVKKILKDAVREISELSKQNIPMPKFGVMLEVPSVAYMMDELIKEVDFFSIGSNDLIQYLLAVDRGNPKVARFLDTFHPAVIRCLYYLCQKAGQAHKPIAVCGEIAANPLGALMLLSLGYTELSMNYSELSRIGYIVRRVNFKDLLELGKKALKLPHSEEIRQLYIDYAIAVGLDKVVTQNLVKRPADKIAN